MAVLKNLVGFGIARQTALGAAAATPVFGFGLASGNIYTLELTQQPDPLTGFGARVRAGSDRTDIVIGATVSFRAYPKSIPLFFYGAMGAIATTGTTPKQHVITVDPNGAQPWFTIFTRYGSEYNSIADCLIDSLTVSFDRGAFDVECHFLGLTPSFGISSWSATNDESTQPRYVSFGGTYTLSSITTTPAAAQVSAGQVQINNNVSAQKLSATMPPLALVSGPMEVSAQLTTQPNDFLDFRRIVTGAAGGTTIIGTPQVGSFSLLATIDANDDMTLASTNWQATAAYPDADPAGGVAELVLDGQGYGATTALTATFHNTYATAY